VKHIIIGNGPAGVVAAETLRKADPGAEIVLIGHEPEPAYSRMAMPYLLECNIGEEGTYLRTTPGHFASLRIRELQGRVVSVDPAQRKLGLADGKFETYDRLLIASGSHPARPPSAGINLPLVQTCWTLGDAAEAPDLFTGAGFIAAIQPNAVDQARVAALNMAGKETRLLGVLAINVLDTLGLISTSFGQWWGEPKENGGSAVECADETNYRYISLQFKGHVLIGATTIGHTDHVGVLRGLIQTRTRLGPWKDFLLNGPSAFMAAYLAGAQKAAQKEQVVRALKIPPTFAPGVLARHLPLTTRTIASPH
jgi:NAD(P)H-nitrite reductase large subunit